MPNRKKRPPWRKIFAAIDGGKGVMETCRQFGLSHTAYYRKRKRFIRDGSRAFVNRPPIAKSHPRWTPPSVVRQLEELACAHPEWTAKRLKEELAKSKTHLHRTTVTTLLRKAGLTEEERVWRCHERQGSIEARLTTEQKRLIARYNPCFLHHRAFSPVTDWLDGPALNWALARFSLRTATGDMWLVRIAIDWYSVYAVVGSIYSHAGADAQYGVHLVRELTVLNTAWRQQLGIIHVVASKADRASVPDNRSGRNAYDRFQRETRALIRLIPDNVAENGFLLRFAGHFQTDFCRKVSEKKFERVADLERALQRWVKLYNSSHRFRGWPNWGETPKERVEAYLRSRVNRVRGGIGAD